LSPILKTFLPVALMSCLVFSLSAQPSSGSAVEINEYLRVFSQKRYLGKEGFIKHQNLIKNRFKESPLILLVDCLQEEQQANYSRALHLFNMALKKYEELPSKQRATYVDNIDSNRMPFSIEAHFSFLKIDLLDGLDRKKDATHQRMGFIRGKYAYKLGLEHKNKADDYHFSKLQDQFFNLCIHLDFLRAEKILGEFKRESNELSDNYRYKVFRMEAELLYFRDKMPEKCLLYLVERAEESEDFRNTNLYKQEKAFYENLLQSNVEELTELREQAASEQPTENSKANPFLKLAEMEFSRANWENAFIGFEKSFQYALRKNPPYRFTSINDHFKKASHYFVEAGFPHEAYSAVLRVLHRPPRWSGSGLSLEQWMNELYLTGILALEDKARGRESLGVEIGALKNKLLWKQMVRVNVAKTLAGKQTHFIRDAFHLSGESPRLWHVFIKVIGPGQMKMLLDEFPILGERGKLYDDYIKAEIALLEGDWTSLQKYATLARENFIKQNEFLSVRSTGLLLKAAHEKGESFSKDLRDEVRLRHPLLLWRLGIDDSKPEPCFAEEELGYLNGSLKRSSMSTIFNWESK